MRDFQPLESGSQGSSSPVLFLDANATQMQLMDAADWRLGAVRDLLDVLACSNLDDVAPRAVAGVARAVLLLTDDAVSLYAFARHPSPNRTES